MDKIKAETDKGQRFRPCRVRVALDQMPDKDRADIEAALADKTIPASVINKVLLEEGYDLDHRSDAMQMHRRGACACAR